MSSALSSALVLGLCALLLLPLLAAYLRPRIAWPLTGVYCCGFLVLIAAKWDYSASARPVEEAVVQAEAHGPSDEACVQVLDVATQAGIVGERTPGRVVVSAAMWNQLPEQTRTALTACLRRSAGGAGAQMEIVEQ